MTKHHEQKKLAEGRIYFSFIAFRSYSIAEGRQDRNTSREALGGRS